MDVLKPAKILIETPDDREFVEVSVEARPGASPQLALGDVTIKEDPYHDYFVFHSPSPDPAHPELSTVYILTADSSEFTAGKGPCEFKLFMPDEGGDINEISAAKYIGMKDNTWTEFDDLHVEGKPILEYTPPDGLTSGAGIEGTDASDGSSWGAGAAMSGVPGVTDLGVGPKVRFGGFSAGVFVDSFVDPSVVPQVGIGGVYFSPQSGLCSGFLCAGADGVGFLPSEVMLLMTGFQTASIMIGTALEDASALPLKIFSNVLTNFLPINQFVGLLSTLGIPTGVGPKAKEFRTVDEFVAYCRAMDSARGRGALTDAVRSVEKAIGAPQNPYVTARLMDLLDSVHAEKNSKEIPFRRVIERNITKAVEGLEEFNGKYADWLKDGSGTRPSDAEIESYKAGALYLAYKLDFQIEREVDGDGEVLNIVYSAPTQIDDPELAVRYVGAVASVYRALGERRSGLTAHMAELTQELSTDFLEAAYGLTKDDGSGEAGRKLMEVEASRSWQVSWIESMAELYGGCGLRVEHVRWIVKDDADDDEGRLLAALADVELPDAGSLMRNLKRSAASQPLPSAIYELVKMGVNALQSAATLSRETFPDEGGDIRLAWDPHRVNNWAARPQIVDAFYEYGRWRRELAQTIESNRKAGDGEGMKTTLSLLSALKSECDRRLSDIMERNEAELRREQGDYYVNHEGLAEHKQFMVRRLDQLAGLVEDLDARKIIDSTEGMGRNGMERATISQEADNLAARIEALGAEVKKFSRLATDLRTGGFGSWTEFFEQVERDSAEVEGLVGRFDDLMQSFTALTRSVEGIGVPEGEVGELFEDWREDLARIRLRVDQVRANYERFNSRRYGARFMNLFAREQGRRLPACGKRRPIKPDDSNVINSENLPDLGKRETWKGIFQ
jgi:hypothetical protein